MKRSQHTPNKKSGKKSKSVPSGDGQSRFKEITRTKSNKLEHHILNFSRLAQNEKSSDIFASALSLSFLYENQNQQQGGEGEDEDMYATIAHLSSFLTSDIETTSITKAHVASLIFPWVTHALLQKKESSSPIIWEAFSLSLETLLKGSATGVSKNEMQLDDILSRILEQIKEGNALSCVDANSKDTIGTVLTQGVMNKLIPCFLRASFQSRGKDQDADIIHMAAKCFGLIVTSDVYRPTMDYVCKDLISLVDSKCSEVEMMPGDSGILPDQAAVLYLTMHLLTTLRKRGRATNPKKTFQLVSSSQVLAPMAHFCKVSVLGDSAVDIVFIVKKVVCFTLYDPFHLDGFRSMNLDVPMLHEEIQRQEQEQPKKKGRKDSNKKNQSNVQSSYQQLLFDAIKMLIENHTEQKNNIENVSLFIPMLIEGYICQSLESDKDSAKWKSRVDATAKLQFRFFSALINPVLNMIKSTKDDSSGRSEQLAMLESILQCTDLLLKYDIYLPSFADPGNQHLNYLTAIGEVILSLAERQLSSGIDISVHLIIFQRLFTLSHHIYHEKLPRLVMCAAVKSIHSRQESVSMELLCNICSTYQKLRQLEHFIQGIISYADDNEQFDLAGHAFIHDTSFVRSFNVAIQSSPIGQTQEVWSLVNQHLLNAKIAGNRDIVVYAVEVFLMILKAIRVGPFSSKAIKEMCEQTMTTVVSTLLALDGDNNDSSSEHGFDLTCDMVISGLNLWGWMVHVHTKCCFWLNEMPHEKKSEDENGMCGSKLIPSLMVTINSVDSTPDKTGRSLEALQLLTCHLLQELHSSIFQQEQIEGLSELVDNQSRRSTDMVKEAKVLSKFVVYAACSQRAGWKMLCESLEIWMPYAEEEHIDSFLRWFLSIQAAEGANEGSGSVLVPVLNEELSFRKYSGEKAAAMALLCDASFFETPYIFQRIASVGLSCVADLLYNKKPNISIHFPGIMNILKMSNSTKTKFSFHNVREATSILSALGLVISTVDYFEDMHLIFEKVLHFHSDTIRYLRTCKSSEYEGGMKLLYICRDLLSDALIKERPKHGDYIDGEKSMLPNILQHIFVSTNDLMDMCENCSSTNHQDIITSGSRFCYAAVMFSINSVSTCSDHIKSLVNSFEDVSNGNYQHHYVIQMMKPSVQLLLSTAELKGETAFSEVVHRATRAIVSSQKVECIKYIEKVLCGNNILPSCDKLSNYLYFISDLLATEHLLIGRKVVHDEALNMIMKRLISILKSQDIHDDHATHSAILYFFGSLVGKGLLPCSATMDSKLAVQEITMHHHQKKRGRTHPVIDATYAKILSETNAEELVNLAANLLMPLNNGDGGDRSSKCSAVVHCFHTMTHVVKGQSQRETLSSMAKRLLPVAYDLIYPFTHQLQVSYEDWSIQIRTAQALLLTLIGKNDIITLKGYDVSNILATVTTIFYRPIEPDKNTFTRIDKNVYVSSCAIVTSLLKYYPKQLYGCVPSFTCTMRSLLNHVMQSKREETDVMTMCQEFRKVCELLPEHKDIFKKHMMHLVLYYIDGIQKSMDPWIKTELEPSIFSLLDSLSEFETKQMNTLMNATTKALFQSVFKNYKKHEYKGQF